MADPSDSDWRRSSLCANASCVEVAVTGGLVLVRDSKGRTLEFQASEWMEFLAGASNQEFDLPAR